MKRALNKPAVERHAEIKWIKSTFRTFTHLFVRIHAVFVCEL